MPGEAEASPCGRSGRGGRLLGSPGELLGEAAPAQQTAPAAAGSCPALPETLVSFLRA